MPVPKKNWAIKGYDCFYNSILRNKRFERQAAECGSEFRKENNYNGGASNLGTFWAEIEWTRKQNLNQIIKIVEILFRFFSLSIKVEQSCRCLTLSHSKVNRNFLAARSFSKTKGEVFTNGWFFFTFTLASTFAFLDWLEEEKTSSRLENWLVCARVRATHSLSETCALAEFGRIRFD